jgi:PPM family protein phosphatase
MHRERLHNGRVFQLDFASRVDRGLVRETNQDVARVVPPLGLAVVADGMGGHAQGDVASRLAADQTVETFERLGGGGANIDQTVERLERAFRDANRLMKEEPTEDEGRSRMGTTLVAAVFAHHHVVIRNVGDSRCYRLRGQRLELLTEDHSYAADLRRAGATDTADGREVAAKWAHVLTRSLNGNDEVEPDVSVVRFEPGDVYLLCSDGLWGAVPHGVMSATIAAAQDANEACERLVSAAWASGGPDNIGVAVIRVVPSHLRLSTPSWMESPARPSEMPAGDA